MKSLAIALLLAGTLPFSNITYLWGVQDGGTRGVYTILAVLVLLFLARMMARSAIIRPEGVIIVLLILLPITAWQSIDEEALRLTVLEFSFRFFCLYGVFCLASRIPFLALDFARFYPLVLFLSFCISLPLWVLYPRAEFVFYDGSAARFGGLHFELFSFMYSLSICYLSLREFNGWKLMSLAIVLFFTWHAQSNAAIPFLIIALAPNSIIIRIFGPAVLTASTILLVFLPILLGGFLDQVALVGQLGLREGGGFNAEGSAIYVRLYPHALAAQTVVEQGFLSALLPNGLGWFGASELIRNTEGSMGGFGSSKMIVDVGVLGALLICLTLSASFNKCCSAAPHMKALTVKLYFLSLFFVSFGSGFFNLVAWFIFLCWPKSIESLKNEETAFLHRRNRWQSRRELRQSL